MTQSVRNVLKQDEARARAHAPVQQDLRGVEEGAVAYYSEADEAFKAKHPPTIRLSLARDGTVVLPTSLIEAMRWYPGGVIIAEMRGDGLFLQSSERAGQRVRAMLRDMLPPEAFEGSWADELIADRRREAAAEEAECPRGFWMRPR